MESRDRECQMEKRGACESLLLISIMSLLLILAAPTEHEHGGQKY